MTGRRLVRLAALAVTLAAACARREPARPAVGAGADLETGDPQTAEAVVAGSPRRFPNPVLVDQDGRSVRFYDDLVRGKVVMVNFSYTQCTGACPRATAQLLAVQRLLGERFGRDFTLVTLSLDPERDTPETMHRYLAAHGARPGWTWLTGRREDLEAIRRFVGYVDRDPALDADRTRHTTAVLLGNDRSGRWSSVPALIPPQQIMDALLRTSGERPTAVAVQQACPK
jgi:protein SCO1/2